MKIDNIVAREIFDSRGNPTVEVDMFASDGNWARASAPSGASCGAHEALEVRDTNRLNGKGVLSAVQNINNIKASLLGRDFQSQREFDELLIELDGTKNKSAIGANATTPLSLCFAKLNSGSEPLYRSLLSNGAGANKHASMPVPMVNIINGGSHSNNNLDIQEFMIMPSASIASFRRRIEVACEVFHMLKTLLADSNYSTNTGDEGGFAPNLKGHKHALDLIVSAIEKAGYKAGEEVYIALDVAANELYKQGAYHIKSENIIMDADALALYYEDLIRNYPIVSIEDPFAEDDIEAWGNFINHAVGGVDRQVIGNKSPSLMIVGDDLYTTNPMRVASHSKVANGIIIKPNQVGTLSESIDAIDTARRNGHKVIISHRSGETEDTTIAHLAVSHGDYIKTGSVSRTDRVCKYNEILRIEEGITK